MLQQAVPSVERRRTYRARMFLVDVVDPHVPHELILPPETLAALDTLERLHPRMGGEMSVQLPFSNERLFTNGARVRPDP